MSESAVTVAIAFHSGYGHTARQAEAVAAGVESLPGARASLLDLSRLDDRLWSELAAADAIVLGSPTYMGSPSAVFQAFAEASGKVWAEQGWSGKLAAGFTTSAGVNGDKLNTLTSMAVFAAQHGMNWVSLGLPPAWLYSSTGTPEDLNRLGGFLGAMAQAPSDLGPEEHPGKADLATAEHLGRRVAETAARYAAGTRALAAVAA
ncbi:MULTISPECIES: flavodoxin family protein [unclassified Kitasatospora]|uniref:flavodoxin family protein n=1 Tax=unclassified Kitasatospora TaxID=2633591 RepID=UPI00070C7DE5|nr:MULTISPECIES: flavodoxin family protein [unclassified Kitasatospora]KQV15516.1 NADPH-dependent FMN reductase [Kitasatospora sp. Root107]KRB63897.1 NADPH-dependent FMN reductase [Kitasatospora sp. Root187]